MRIIPAIDLKNGLCVRLVEGRAESAKIYDVDPLEIARLYQAGGAEVIHVVDLDGAFLGAASDNQKIIRRIAQQVSIPIEVGGGIRSIEDIRTLRGAGVDYIILGTLAVENPDVVEVAVREMPGAVVVAIDAWGLRVSVRGWTEETSVDAIDLARRMVGAGVRRIIYTDISRDGKLAGPNVELTRLVAAESGAQVTASGGIATLEDIRDLCGIQSFGVDSCIVGKALYEGRFTLEQAIVVGNVGQSSGGPEVSEPGK
jgi:phosphoribosylformimino-5-aminoimidazole carboxamide ribotide isomerase